MPIWTHAYVLLLAAFAPPPCLPGDLDRFPRVLLIEPTLAFDQNDQPVDTHNSFSVRPNTTERLEWLKAQRAVDFAHVDDWDAQIAEQDYLNEVWGLLEYAWRCREEYHADPIDQLTSLRARIGEQAYLAGQMPPPVPLRRYVDISR